jgi:hypothetical protein
MIFKSDTLASYILNKFELVKENVSKIYINSINLFIAQRIEQIKSSMFARNFTAREIATMILNEDNPKTMDYFFMKLLKVKINHAAVSYGGMLNISMVSENNRVASAFSMLGRQQNFERGQIYFTMDMHANQIFPKSRSFRICGRKLLPISVKNPQAGTVKTTMYASGYSNKITEPDEILQPKHIILYCRNAWERKGEVKPSRAKANNEEVMDATATAISVI